MSEPWMVASDLMKQYFVAKGITWPAITASRLLTKVSVSRDHRWTRPELVKAAEDIITSAFFDVDDLAENHLGIRVDYESLEYLDEAAGSRVLGCAYPREKAVVICERTLQYFPLYRATMLHELGHILLHTNMAKRCILYTPDLAPSSPEEREANQFMHVALLPKGLLRLAIGYLCHAYGIDIRLALCSADSLRGRHIWKEQLFVPLVSLLAVSREMIAIKLRSQKVFSGETVKYHKSYPLQNRWKEKQTQARVPQLGRVLDIVLTRAASPVQPSFVVGG